LNEYYATTYYKDIIDRYNIRDKKLLEGFMGYVLNIYSSLLSLTKLEKHLKDE
jgi:predicted AAA+ superfamily ATPase